MTFHTSSSRKPKGSNAKSPRLSACYDPADMKIIVWLAGVKKIPAATVLRDAVAAYVLPFRNNPNLKNQFGSKL